MNYRLTSIVSFLLVTLTQVSSLLTHQQVLDNLGLHGTQLTFIANGTGTVPPTCTPGNATLPDACILATVSIIVLENKPRLASRIEDALRCSGTGGTCVCVDLQSHFDQGLKRCVTQDTPKLHKKDDCYREGQCENKLRCAFNPLPTNKDEDLEYLHRTCTDSAMKLSSGLYWTGVAIIIHFMV